MSQKLVMLIMAVLLSAVQGHRYCPDGDLSLTNQLSTTPTDFKYISYYLDSFSKQSIPFMVKEGDSTNSFTLRRLKPEGEISDPVKCKDTQGFKFIGLQNQHLILLDVQNSKFYFCAYYGTSADIDRIQILKPDPDNVVQANDILTSIAPLGSKKSDQVFVAARLKKTSGKEYMIIAYFSYASIPGPTQKLLLFRAFAQGHLAPIFDSTRSLGEVVYNPVDNSFYGADTTNAKQFKKIQGQAALATVNNPSNIKVFTLRSSRAVLTTNGDDKKTGKVWKFDQNGASSIDDFQVTTPASNDDFEYYSDGVNNFARLSTGRIDWLVLTSLDVSVFWKATLGSNSNPAVTVSYADVMNIGFSRNKISIITVSGTTPNQQTKITTFRMTGNTKFQKQYQQTVKDGPDSDKFLDTANYQSNITPKCLLCKAIQFFTCFSQTLNCFITTKAIQECGIKQDITNAWFA